MHSQLALHGLPKVLVRKVAFQSKREDVKRKLQKNTHNDWLADNNQSPVSSRQEQHVDGGSCMIPSATMENAWMSPPCSYHMLTYVEPNIMHSLPPQIPFPCVWPQSTSNPLQSSWNPSTSVSYVISPFPFTLKFLNSWIQICQACQIPFHSSSTEPPYDMVGKSVGLTEVKKVTPRPPSTPGNSHYHVSMNCIRSAEPRFISHQWSTWLFGRYPQRIYLCKSW